MSILVLIPVAVTLLFVLAADGLAALVRRSWAECFPTTMFLALLVLFVGGSFNRLSHAWWLAALGLVALSAVGVVSRLWPAATSEKPSRWERLRGRGLRVGPAPLLVLGLAATGAELLRGLEFSSWDEFSHWGRVQRATATLNALAPYADVPLRFRNYPPGAGLLGYFVSHARRTFVESDAIFASGLFLTALFVPLLVKATWRRLDLIAAWLCAVVLVPTIFFDAYTTVYGDTPLGMLLGYGLLVGLLHTGWRRVLHLAPALALMGLMKPIGVFFGLVVVVACLGLAIARRGEAMPRQDWRRWASWNRAGMGAVLLAALLLPPRLYSWALARGGLPVVKSGGGDLARWWRIVRREGDELHTQMTEQFLRSVWSGSVSSRPFAISIATWALIIASLLWAIAALARRVGWSDLPWRTSLIAMLVGLVAHVIGMHYSYCFYFAPYEMKNLASFSRYAGSYLVGCVFLVVGFGLLALGRATAFAHGPGPRSWLALSIVAPLVLLGRPDVTAMLLYRQPTYAAKEIRGPVGERVAALYKCGVKPGHKIFVLVEHTSGMHYWVYSYALLQNQVSGWSIGDPKDANDSWTKPWTKAQFAAEMKPLDYVFIHQSAPTIDKRYGSFFPGGHAQTGRLYKVKETSATNVQLIDAGC